MNDPKRSRLHPPPAVPWEQGRRPPTSPLLPQVAVALLVLMLLGVAACTSRPSTTNTTTTAPSPGPPPQTATPAACPNPHGGTCIGPLAAGRYQTTTFQPSITYTVPNGWVNGEDLPGNFLLVRAGDPQEGIYGGNYVGIYRDAVAAAENCDERAEPGIGVTPQDLATWLTGRRGLDATEPQPVTVGGLDGVVVDVTLDKGWRTTCSFSEGKPVVPLIIGSGVSDLHHVILPGMSVRLYLLATETGNVVIEVAHVPGQGTFTEYLREVVPIVQSIAFGAP